MSYEDIDITMWRSGEQWQAIDPAHGCRYCKNRVINPDGATTCAPYQEALKYAQVAFREMQDALHGFGLAGELVMPVIPLPTICDDYELDHAAFWAGEKRSPNLEEIVPGRQPGGEPLPVVGR